MMALMFARTAPSRTARTARTADRRLPALAAGLLLLAACGGSDDEPETAVATTPTSTEVVTTEPAPPTTEAEPATTTTKTPASTTTTEVPATTTTESTTTTFAPIETSLATTTTPTTLVVKAPPAAQAAQAAPAAPEPIAPPADSYAEEPIIEVGSIAIPKIGVDMTMYEGIRLTTLDYGPGHWPGTAMPGQVGNVVVGGHRTSSHRVFRDIDQLVSGDEILFRDGAGEYRYTVNRVEIVDPSAVWIVNPTETATATLFACHPPGSTKQRIVVFADLAAG